MGFYPQVIKLDFKSMRFTINADNSQETRVGSQVASEFPARELEDWLHFKNYGNDLVDVGIILMCRNPEYNFKQRIRMDRKNKILYIDLMLDYHYFVSDIPKKIGLVLLQKKYLKKCHQL